MDYFNIQFIWLYHFWLLIESGVKPQSRHWKHFDAVILTIKIVFASKIFDNSFVNWMTNANDRFEWLLLNLINNWQSFLLNLYTQIVYGMDTHWLECRYIFHDGWLLIALVETPWFSLGSNMLHLIFYRPIRTNLLGLVAQSYQIYILASASTPYRVGDT